jgi:hypothetical protein
MEQLIDYFVKNVTTDKMWIAFLALAIYYVLKKEPFKVFAHFSQKREKEHTLAKELLETGKLTKEANEFLREHLEHYAFKRYYGISADAEMRNALIKFQRKHQRDLSWSQVRRAYVNIRLKGTKIVATLSWVDHAFRWLVTALCWLVSAYALFVIGFAVLAGSEISRRQFFALTATALLLLLTAVLFSSMNWPYHNTRTVMRLSDGES